MAQELGETQENVLNKILDVWLDKMALVTQLERRKLLGLALTSLLTSQSRYNSILDYKYMNHAINLQVDCSVPYLFNSIIICLL